MGVPAGVILSATSDLFNKALAISKADYEEAIAIYELFVTFVKEKATKRLINSRNFNDFQVIAKDSLSRIN